MTKATGTTPRSTNTATSTLLAGRDMKGFKLAPPMIDVRGWEVLRADGSRLGTVDRIMLDVKEKKPRYLAVVSRDRTGVMLLPIGLGTLQPANHRLILSTLPKANLLALPLLTSEVVSHDFEREVYGAVTGKPATSMPAPMWYTDPIFDPRILLGAVTKAQPS